MRRSNSSSEWPKAYDRLGAVAVGSIAIASSARPAPEIDATIEHWAGRCQGASQNAAELLPKIAGV
jgi:hypothetical protein